jgi:hypothetical protein
LWATPVRCCTPPTTAPGGWPGTRGSQFARRRLRQRPGDVFAEGSNAVILHRNDPETPLLPDPIFYVQTDGSLYEKSGAAPQLLSPAGTILSISSVTDASGQADVYAITSDHHLWEFRPPGWISLSVGSFKQLSAATNLAGNAIIFAVLTANSLWEDSSLFGGWRNLSPAGTILSASAVTDALGNDDVFAVTSDSHLWEHRPAGWAMVSSDSFQTNSAGITGAGQSVAYGVLTDNSLWQYNPALAGNGQVNFSPAGTILAAAAGNDTVFAITADHHLWRHLLSGWELASASSFQALSGNAGAVGGSEVFAVLTDTSLREYQLPLLGTPFWSRQVTSGVQAGSAPRHG